ncbi:MAG: hypothetical protein KQH63_04700 [Desulfobulbaceae bacterium]|nr:hypothetical protein [Desulfobulbaceae bacterium]
MAIRNIYIFLTLLLVVGMTISTSGCSTLGRNLAQDNTVKIALLDQNKRVYVSSANVYEKNNKLAVYGLMKKTPGSSVRLRGHVDINVIGPDNKVLAAKTVRPRPVNPHPNVRTASFAAFLDIVPPSGSIVQIAAHKGLHP